MTAAHLTVDPRFAIGTVRRRLFGGFVEHLRPPRLRRDLRAGPPGGGRAGIPHRRARARTRAGRVDDPLPRWQLRVGFRWEDSVGPARAAPRRLDLAWHSTETNEVGLHEFADWLDKAGSELMLAVNLGTRGVLEALDLLEYSNVPGWHRAVAAEDRQRPRRAVRRARVVPRQRMDGPWQLGHRSADDYGTLAAQTARGMRQMDPSIELVVCGSSGAAMPTFGEWEREVLTHTYDDVDMISCHAYYQSTTATRPRSSPRPSTWTASSRRSSPPPTTSAPPAQQQEDRHLVRRVERLVHRPRRRREAHRDRRLAHRAAPARRRVFGPGCRRLRQSPDLAVETRRSRRLGLARTVVNVIAPIMTEPGGPAWRQTTFFPFALTSPSRGARRCVCGSRRPRSTRRGTERSPRWMPWPPSTTQRKPSRCSSSTAASSDRWTSRST